MHSKLYVKLMNSKEWRQLRWKKLEANPLCERCQQRGYIVAASVVHHITEVESVRTEQECADLAFRWTNLQALCRECHAEIHKAAHSHSKEAHQQRERERLAQWAARHGGQGRPPGV